MFGLRNRISEINVAWYVHKNLFYHVPPLNQEIALLVKLLMGDHTLRNVLEVLDIIPLFGLIAITVGLVVQLTNEDFGNWRGWIHRLTLI
jgi:hypothetical protein